MIEGAENSEESTSSNLTNELKSRVLSNLNTLSEELSPTEMSIPLASSLFSKIPVQGSDFTPKEKITGFGNFLRNAAEHNEFMQLSKGTSRLLSRFTNDYLADDIPSGWTPANEEALLEVSPEYYNYVLSARSPKEQAEYIEIAQEQMKNQELMSEGGIGSTLLGSAAGIITSPTSLWVPVALASKAGFAAHTFESMAKLAPYMATQSLLHEGILQYGSPGFSERDLLLNTARDTAFGLILYGGGRAITFGSNKANIWEARKTVNAVDEGIGIKLEVGTEGEIKGLVATDMDGSVGAARVDVAQRYLDSQPVFDGVAGIISRIGGAKFLGSPLIQGLNSPFATVVDWTNGLANSSIITRGIQAGGIRKETMEESLNVFTKNALQASNRINDLFLDSLGITPNIAAPAKVAMKNIGEGLDTTKSAFYDKVRAVRLTGEKSNLKQVNEAAEVYDELTKGIYKRFLEVNDFPTDIMPPKTAVDYFTRAYDLQFMVENPELFYQTVSGSLKKQNQQILARTQPIDKGKQRIKDLNAERDIPISKGGRKNIQITNDLIIAKKELEKLEKQLISDIRDGIIDPALLDDRVWLNNAETNELRKLLEPIKKLENEIDAKQADIDFLNPRQKMSKAKRQSLKEELAELKSKRVEALDELRDEARAGQINKKLFLLSEKTNDIEFRDPDKVPKFRRVHKNNDEILSEAKAYYDTLLNQAPEQVQSAVLSKIAGGGTDPAAARTLLIPDVDLANAGFLSNNIEQLMTTYSRTMGRKIIMKERFAETSIDDGFKGLVADLSLERNQKMNAILKNEKLTEPKRKKQLLKLDKEFQEAKKLMEDSYKVFMGTHIENSRMQRNVKTMTSMAAIAQLKNVPLLQLTETTAMIIAQGFGKVITRGMVPLIKKLNVMKKDAFFKDNASHALVGMEMGLQRLAQETIDGLHVKGHPGVIHNNLFQNYIEKVSRGSQALFGTNQIMNFQQKLSADITQSRVMSEIFKASKGKLSKRKLERLGMSGIDPSRAKDYIKQYNDAKGFSELGGYQSNWFLWKDTELSNSMAMAIRADIKNTILEAGILDKPFAASSNPILQFVFQYTGYLYAAYNRFAIPFAQRPDFDKMTGLLFLMSAGAMIEPMRAWQRGEEFELDSEKSIDQWLASGFIESGVGGWPIELIQRAGAIVDIPGLERYKQDKFRRRPSAGVIGGPFFSYLDSMAQLAGMAISGEINKQDLSRSPGNGLAPVNLGLDRIIKSSIRNSDLPETRAQARR